MSFIDNLQTKPKRTKILIMWTATICVMLVIIAIWLFSFSKSVKPKQGLEQTQLPSIFQSIGKDFSTLKQKLNASIKEIKDQTDQLENTNETNLDQNEGEKGQ